MLTRLVIANLATIASLTLELEHGFTVLTGETGAGKSILIDALRFVLGGKAVGDKVRTGARHTLVEAAFDVSALEEARNALKELDIPCDGEMVVRRVLQENGRSRALVNDCAITQARLETLGRFLVNIHGQHDNQMLLDSGTHIDFLDAYAGLLPLRAEVGAAHAAYTRVLRERKEQRAHAEAWQQRTDELSSALEELREANLAPGEEESLREEHGRLTHAEELAALLGSMCEALSDGDANVLAQLTGVAHQLGHAATLDGGLKPLLEQLGPARIQLDELYQSLRARGAGLEADPERLEWVNLRLSELERVRRRHGGSIDAAIERMAEVERELAGFEDAEENLARLDEQVQSLAGNLHALSAKLSSGRRAAATELDAAVSAQLRELGMERATFETRMQPLDTSSVKGPSYSANGMDAVEFLLSTNPGQAVRPLSRIASGGELSRTMLALKTVLAQADPTGTLIFDEVDAGISGRMAEIVGRKLRRLGATHQVLCVTHLPQIAALGNRHVRVSKQADNGQTYTQAELLDEQQKVHEVARLLSGLEVTSHAVASAEEMVNRGRTAGASN